MILNIILQIKKDNSDNIHETLMTQWAIMQLHFTMKINAARLY